MSVTRKHGIYGVSLGATVLGGITQQSLVTGTQVKGEAVSGSVYARLQYLVGQKVAPGFSTYAIAAALAVLGATGKSIADLTGGLSLWAQKHIDGGTRAGANLHRKFNFTKGIVTAANLRCDHQGDATLSCETVVTYDGTNDPVVVSDLQSLPTTPTDTERFTLGGATLGSVSLPQVRNLSIDFGIEIDSEGADSDIWDTLASIRAITPKLTLGGIDVEWLKAANIPLTGKAATHATSTVYLRKRASGGTFVADATAQHIAVTVDGLIYVDKAFDASGNEAAECSLVVPLRYDGTNEPLTISTASAIS